MFKKQTAIKFHTVRRKSKRIAGGREGKCFEIAIDQNEDRVWSGNRHFRRLNDGIRKRLQRLARSNHCASVTNLEINCFITFYGKDLHSGSKFIQFFHLNGSSDQNLYILSFKSNTRKMSDHLLMIIGQLCTSSIKFRIVKRIKMLCKIFCGKFRDAGSADVGMHSRACAGANGHNGNFTFRITSAGILII